MTEPVPSRMVNPCPVPFARIMDGQSSDIMPGSGLAIPASTRLFSNSLSGNPALEGSTLSPKYLNRQAMVVKLRHPSMPILSS